MHGRLCLLGLLAALQLGCSAVSQKPLLPQGPPEVHRKIAIFFDGTHNDEASDTNVKKLHSLVSLQASEGLATLWIEGVGTGIDLAGMALGVGTAARVRMAYEFLLDHYRPGDQIYLFGFSRGAWNARVLAALLFNAGLPTWPGHTVSDRATTAFSVFKGRYQPSEAERDRCGGLTDLQRMGHADRRAAVTTCLDRLGFTGMAPISVEVLGLWDTVEALGFPDWGPRLLHKIGIRPMAVDIDKPNPLYGDQLCNVRRAYHALSIDDNREWIFTPLLLTRKHLFQGCPQPDGEHLLDADGKVQPGRLKEVWFAGAHSDVGGGYANGLLSGVSLNWMLEQLAMDGLVPPHARVRQDPYGSSHDPHAGILAGVGYHAIARNVAAWPLQDGPQGHRDEFRGALCLHGLVFDRRRAQAVQAHENAQLLLLQPGPVCLEPDPGEQGVPQRLRQAIQPVSRCADAPKLRLHLERFPDCRGMQ